MRALMLQQTSQQWDINLPPQSRSCGRPGRTSTTQDLRRTSQLGRCNLALLHQVVFKLVIDLSITKWIIRRQQCLGTTFTVARLVLWLICSQDGLLFINHEKKSICAEEGVNRKRNGHHILHRGLIKTYQNNNRNCWQSLTWEAWSCLFGSCDMQQGAIVNAFISIFFFLQVCFYASDNLLRSLKTMHFHFYLTET